VTNSDRGVAVARRLSEILADIDSALKRVDSAPLLQKHTPALEGLKFTREALGALTIELARRPGATDVIL
jgi:hypothetical protein